MSKKELSKKIKGAMLNHDIIEYVEHNPGVQKYQIAEALDLVNNWALQSKLSTFLMQGKLSFKHGKYYFEGYIPQALSNSRFYKNKP